MPHNEWERMLEDTEHDADTSEVEDLAERIAGHAGAPFTATDPIVLELARTTLRVHPVRVTDAGARRLAEVIVECRQEDLEAAAASERARDREAHTHPSRNYAMRAHGAALVMIAGGAGGRDHRNMNEDPPPSPGPAIDALQESLMQAARRSHARRRRGRHIGWLPTIAAVILLAAAIWWFVTAIAGAARPPLTQARADAQARIGLQEAVHDMTDPDMIEGGEPVPAERTELDPADVERSSATADFTIYFVDGDACDGYVEIRLTRRGLVRRDYEVETCDSLQDPEPSV